MKRFRNLVVGLAIPAALCAADSNRIVVHMELQRGVTAWMGQTIDFGLASREKVIAAPGSQRTGRAPRVIVTVVPIEGQPGAYRLTISPINGDSVTATVAPDKPAHVQIPRGVSGTLPYLISINPNAGPNGSPMEMMFWQTEYVAEGTLSVGGCKAKMAVWDMTSDGEFTRRDFNQGTAVGIDLNGDGKYLGREEHVTGGEIFQFCGKAYYVDPDSLEPDGSAITVVETAAEKPRLGSTVPSFVAAATDGSSVRSESWRGKVIVLDFWASWCHYCIAGFPVLKEMRQSFAPNLEIVSINTDEPSAMTAARRVLSENDLPWIKIMSGKGLNDPVWMMFQAMDTKSLPLYVVLDPDGVIRYDGAGGEDLTELRAAVEKLVPR